MSNISSLVKYRQNQFRESAEQQNTIIIVHVQSLISFFFLFLPQNDFFMTTKNDS